MRVWVKGQTEEGRERETGSEAGSETRVDYMGAIMSENKGR